MGDARRDNAGRVGIFRVRHRGIHCDDDAPQLGGPRYPVAINPVSLPQRTGHVFQQFAVQLLQMVHGQADDQIRQPTTLSALAALTEGGYVGREEGSALHDAYGFLRTVEHRMQLHQLRRTHVLPEDEASLRRLGRSLGYLRDSVPALQRALREHRREVRRLHEKLFYRPLLEAVRREGAR